jgi:hypothetical protein
LSTARTIAPIAMNEHTIDVPHTPDPLSIAAKFRVLLPDLEARRGECAALVNAYPANAAYRDAYTQASAACAVPAIFWPLSWQPAQTSLA